MAATTGAGSAAHLNGAATPNWWLAVVHQSPLAPRSCPTSRLVFKHQHFIISDQFVEIGIEEIRVIQGFVGII